MKIAYLDGMRLRTPSDTGAWCFVEVMDATTANEAPALLHVTGDTSDSCAHADLIQMAEHTPLLTDSYMLMTADIPVDVRCTRASFAQFPSMTALLSSAASSDASTSTSSNTPIFFTAIG